MSKLKSGGAKLKLKAAAPAAAQAAPKHSGLDATAHVPPYFDMGLLDLGALDPESAGAVPSLKVFAFHSESLSKLPLPADPDRAARVLPLYKAAALAYFQCGAIVREELYRLLTQWPTKDGKVWREAAVPLAPNCSWRLDEAEDALAMAQFIGFCEARGVPVDPLRDLTTQLGGVADLEKAAGGMPSGAGTAPVGVDSLFTWLLFEALGGLAHPGEALHDVLIEGVRARAAARGKQLTALEADITYADVPGLSTQYALFANYMAAVGDDYLQTLAAFTAARPQREKRGQVAGHLEPAYTACLQWLVDAGYWAPPVPPEGGRQNAPDPEPMQRIAERLGGAALLAPSAAPASAAAAAASSAAPAAAAGGDEAAQTPLRRLGAAWWARCTPRVRRTWRRREPAPAVAAPGTPCCRRPRSFRRQRPRHRRRRRPPPRRRLLARSPTTSWRRCASCSWPACCRSSTSSCAGAPTSRRTTRRRRPASLVVAAAAAVAAGAATATATAVPALAPAAAMKVVAPQLLVAAAAAAAVVAVPRVKAAAAPSARVAIAR